MVRRITLALTLLALAACERPPVIPPDLKEGDIEGRFGPVDFLAFVQDRPAVGGDWYLYNEEAGHLLTPFAQAYLIREGAGPTTRFAAVRVLSYYHPNTAESGTFTLGYALWDGSDWSSETEWLTSTDIKVDGPLCLDLFTESEVDCAGSGWQVELRAYPFMAREGPILVNRPGLFFRSAEGIASAGSVRVATVGAGDLGALPAPDSLDELEDRVAPSWEQVSWDLSRYAVDLPQAGMALGSRVFGPGFTDLGEVYLLLTPRREVSRFQVRPVTDGAREGGVEITFASVDVDLSDNTIPDAFPAATSTTVPSPAPGETVYLRLDADSGRVELADLEGADPPHLPPRETRWDLALRRTDAGDPRVLLSPGAAVYNATALDGVTDLEEALPPR